MLRVDLLKTPGVYLDGEPVTFPFKRAEALLYYMLIRHSATRQELIGLLWESCDETVGLKNLRNVIYTLKKVLGGEILLSPQKSLIVVNEAWEIDCDYERFTRQGDLSAYQGLFLQGFSLKNAFSYEEWLERTRDRLQERYLSALAERAELARDAEQEGMAQHYAAEYLREDPFNEKMVCFLMEEYRRVRQYAKAAQVYQRLKEALSGELGAVPLEETTVLYYQIMNEWNDTATQGEPHDQRAAQASPPDGEAENSVPTDELLLSQLAGLGKAAVQVAQILSLCPQGVPCGILQPLAGQTEQTLARGIEELSGRGLIVEARGNGAPSYSFSNQRLRELVYLRQSFFRRRKLHLRLARLLAEQSGGADKNIACRVIAWHYRMGQAELPALDYEIQALELETAQCCQPFPVLTSASTENSLEKLAEGVKQAREDLAALRREQPDAAELEGLERRLILIRGRMALFQGRMAEGSAILGALSVNAEPERDGGLMLQACYLLASYALSTQSADLAERYLTTGMRLVERRSGTVQLAMLERLRGGLFCLRGEYDKSVYYLLEAIEALEKLPDSAGCRLQIAGAYYDFGRVCRQQQDYAKACSYYKKALAMIGETGWCPGAVWLYVHYGRATFALEDHTRAQKLFQKGYEMGIKHGELCGLTAAAAYTAYYEMQNEHGDRAAQALTKAQEVSELVAAPLEKGILYFISMKLRGALELGRCGDPDLRALLPDPAEHYARQGMRVLRDIPDVFELEMMSRSLKNGITQKQNYRARELYSVNRNFMGE